MTLEQINQMALRVERSWCAAWASLGAVRAEPPTTVDDLPTMLRVYTPGQAETLLNIVMRYSGPASNSGDPSDERVPLRHIEQVIAPYREHRLPFQWWLTRGMEPPGLRASLDELGMETWGGATMMLLALDGWAPSYPPTHPSVTLRHALSDDDALAAVGVICSVFYIPRAPMLRWTTLNPSFDLWLATGGGRPLAAMASQLAGETVGVFHVATQPGARRRGLAGNLLLLALRDAQARGARWAALTATPEARALYEALGFASCGLLEQWMPGARLQRELTGVPAGGFFEGYWG